jgi:hypothetical protein
MRTGAPTRPSECLASIEVLRDLALGCVSVLLGLEWIRNPMLYPFELRALSDKPSAPSWNRVEASTRRNAFRASPLRSYRTEGALAGQALRLGSTAAMTDCEQLPIEKKAFLELATAGRSARFSKCERQAHP